MPDVIPDDEAIVRSIRATMLDKKGRVVYGAYRPSANKTLISVLRGSRGKDWCRSKAIEIAGPDYAGLAILIAHEIRALHAHVVDAPDGEGCFPGHAHIDHIDPPLPAGDPLAPEVNKILNDRCKALAKTARYYADCADLADGLQGLQLP